MKGAVQGVQAAGNQFSARVFPIPARGRKELILSYSQEIGPTRPYVIPLRGLPELGPINVAGQVFVFFALTVAAAEVAVGLAIIIALYRAKSTINIDEFQLLKW